MGERSSWFQQDTDVESPIGNCLGTRAQSNLQISAPWMPACNRFLQPEQQELSVLWQKVDGQEKASQIQTSIPSLGMPSLVNTYSKFYSWMHQAAPALQTDEVRTSFSEISSDTYQAVFEKDSMISEWNKRMGRSTGWCTHSSYFSPRWPTCHRSGLCQSTRSWGAKNKV